MRLFVAAPVAGRAREVIAASSSRVRDDRLSWTRPDGWHCTLAFVGDVDDGEAPLRVVEATRVGVARAAVDAVTVTTGRVHTLARGRALVVELVDDPEGALGRLGRSIQRALVEAGLDVAERRVRPHLTLGRARRRRLVPDDVVAVVEVPPVSWTCDRVEVVESVLGHGPATYVTVATVPLSG